MVCQWSVKVLLFTLFVTCDQRFNLVIGTESAAIASISLVTHFPESLNLSAIQEILPTHNFSVANRHRRSADIIKKSFTTFAKRLWQGFRMYIQGKITPRRRFGSERLRKIMKLSMPTEAPIEFIHVTENVKLLQSSTKSPLLKNYRGREELNLTTVNIYLYLRQKWKHQLVSETYEKSQRAIVNYVQSLSDNAIQLYQSLDRRPNRWYLWKLKPGDTPASDFTTQFHKLYKLTLAYGTNGTAFYENRTVLMSIIEGIDFMVTKKGGYDGEKYHGHWWHWLIGVPDSFTKIMMIIDEELTKQQKDLYIRIITNYVSNPLFTKRLNRNINVGVYSSNLAETVLALGILQEHEGLIRLSIHTVTEVLKPSVKGDIGFYPDGSFTHKNIPYTGLYGKALVESIAQILFITEATHFELDSNIKERLVDLIDRAFLPLIFDGEIIATVCGRGISRAQPNTKMGYGSTLLFDLLIVSKSASPSSRQKLQEAVKFWMRRNPMYYLTNTRNYNDISMMTELLEDDSVVGDELPFYGVKLYASMDRFVQRTPDYMLGLSLYSSRIAAFDAGNTENKHGWHTADGMVYLYNDDEVQFNAAYWPTVDPLRLPGTTVDTIHLFDELLNTRTTSTEKWVGGVANNNQAVVGMSLNKKGSKNRGMALAMDLRAKKSWFVVEEQIVALGAGISGKTIASIETIVDNRLLNDNLDYAVLSNEGVINNPAAAAVALDMEKRRTRLNILWILLQESTHKASIGYYFPTKETVDLIFERRTGTYFDINEEFKSTHQFAGNYTKLLIRHGRKPVNASYAYVMLPGITKQTLKAYVATNTVVILENTADIQAVKIKENNYLGINIWNESGGEIAGISSNKPASILKQSKNNEDTYVISDPTQSNSTIQIKIPEFTKLVSTSEGVEYDGEYDVFIINFGNRNGASEQFTVLFLIYEQIHS